MTTIVNTIRWADNTAALRANLLSGIDTIDAMKTSVDRLVTRMGGTGLFEAANKTAAAIQELGGVTKLTAAEQERANAIIEKAIEKYEAMGVAAPTAVRALGQELSATLKQTETATVSLQTRLSAIGSAAQTVGIGLSAALTAPLVGMGAAAIKSSVDFETAFAGVRKTVSGTPKELDAINASFREMAKATPATAVELAKIGEMAGQLGVQKEKIVGFTKTIIDISTATNLTADEAGSAFARLANVMKMPQEQFSNLGSAVVALGNFGASTEQEMLSMGQRIAAAGATAGMSVAQVLGIANALSSVGIEAEAGGTAMSRVINKISMDVASGGGKLETFAKIAGKSAADFATSWRADAGVAFSDFMQGLAKARERGGDELLGLMHELGFDANVRLVNAFMSAANAGNLMRDSIALGTKAFQENTEITRASEERYKTTANQLKILQNNLNDVALTIGDALLPMLNDLVKSLVPMVGHVGDLAKEFRALPDAAKYTSVAFVGLVAAIGPVILAIGGVAFAFTQVMGLLTAFPAIGMAAATAFTAISSGAIGMVSIAAGVIAAAAAVGTLTYALTRLIDVASGGKLSSWLTPFIAGSADAKAKAEAAAAGADAMALAFQRTGIRAKDAAEALALNTEWLRQHNVQIAESKNATAAFVGPLQQAAHATQTLADKVRALSDEQKADIASKVQQGYGIKNIAKETGIAAEVVSAYVKQITLAHKGSHGWKDAMDELASAGANWHHTLDGIDGVVVEAVKWYLAAGVTQHTLAEAYGLTAVQVKAVTEALKEEEAIRKTLQNHEGEIAKEWKKLQDDRIKDAANAHKAITDSLRANLNIEGQMESEHADFIRRNTMSTFDYQRARLDDWINDEEGKLDYSRNGWESAYAAIHRVAQDRFNGIAMAEADALADMHSHELSWSNEFHTILSNIPRLLEQAFTGGGGIAGAFKALASGFGGDIGGKLFAAGGPMNALGNKLTQGLSGIFGSSVGNAFGLALPGIGTAIGALAGPLIGAFGRLFANPEKEINPIREAFVQTFGAGADGLKNLSAQIMNATGSLALVNQLLAAKDKDQYKTAIDAINGALTTFKTKLDAAHTAQQTINDRMAHLTSISPELQAALEKAFNAKTVDDYSSALSTISGILDKADTKQQHVNDSLKELGLTALDAGESFRKAEIDRQAEHLSDLFHTVKDAGVDVNLEMRKMGPNLNQFVADAKKAGVDVPESMQEVLQVAIDAGVLFDENGNKITDMSQLGLKFGKDTTQATKDVTSAMEHLAEVIEKLLGPKIQGIIDKSNDIPENPFSGWEVPDLRIPNGGDFAATGGLVTTHGIVQHFGMGGSVASLMPRGTDIVPAMLTPGEVILNAGQQRNVAAALTAGAGGNVVDFAAFRDLHAVQERTSAAVERMERYFSMDFRRDNARAIREAFQDGRRRG